jgi:hypothetical protein
MSYLDVTDPKLLEDLSKRKEFYLYNIDPYKENRFNIFDHTKSNSKYILDELFKKEIYLEPHSYQHAMRNFFSPNTPYTRLLAKWATGQGKTPFALMVALEFTQRFVSKGKGKVFVLGFNENIFKKELLKFPEFGFITRSEIDELSKLTTKSKSGNERDIGAWQDYISLLKRRITSGKGNGLFQFYGYKAFVNRLFVLEDSELDINNMNEEEIRKAVQDGSMKVNIELLDSFKDSLIICDEIHNVYNSLEKNNWGIAIQVVLDHYPNIKAVFLSATPMNNSPTEIVDLLNLLIPNKVKFKKSDIFDGSDLKKGAEEKIRQLLRGRISFIQDTNPRYFPTQTIVGTKIPGIDYLKFNRAPMSKFHFGVYKKVYKGTLSQDSQYLIDIAIPDPTGETPGLYQTGTIMRKIPAASEAWKKKHGIDYNDKIGLTGDFMLLENIGKYSAKFKLLLTDIMDLLSNGIDEGKLFIYHNIVHISGVLFIQEMLRINGILTGNQEPLDNTPCSICGKIKKAHKATVDKILETPETPDDDEDTPDINNQVKSATPDKKLKDNEPHPEKKKNKNKKKGGRGQVSLETFTNIFNDYEKKGFKRHTDGYLIIGPPGVGKSTFANNQKEKNWIDMDTMYDKLGLNWKSLKDKNSSPEERQKIYREADKASYVAKDHGFRVLGALFWDPGLADAFVVPPLATHKEYLNKREDLKKYRKYIIAFRKSLLTVSKKLNIPTFDSVEKAVEYLEKNKNKNKNKNNKGGDNSKLLELASINKAEILDDIKTSINEFKDVRLSDLEFMIKSKESISRKLKLRPYKQLNDILRFTIIVPFDKFDKFVNDICKNLIDQTYIKIHENNYMCSPNIYYGVNMKFKKDSIPELVFEIQFHTDETRNLRQEIHSIYDEYRLENIDDMKKCDIYKQMVKASKVINVPEYNSTYKCKIIPDPNVCGDIILLDKNGSDYTEKLGDAVTDGYVVIGDLKRSGFTKLKRMGGKPKSKPKSKLIKGVPKAPVVKSSALVKDKLTKGLIDDHTFEPVRLLSVHSDIDKSEVEKNIERYNIDDNIEGVYYKFLIGSRLIKEAYSFEGVRYSLIVGRPDNIPTFIQVLGRGKRKKSHTKLPEDKRTNEVRIYTSSLPGGKLSHEEIKYKEKMKDYLIIQRLEKIMHESAVDAITSRPLIERGLKEENMDLYILPYVPEIKIQNMDVNKLINSTYESFYFHREIQFITFMIKRIFVEVGTVFKYDELWTLVRKPHHNTEFLTEVFDESYFMIALNNLAYDKHDEDYRFPYVTKVDKNATVLDILRNSIDRRVVFPNGQKNFISYIDGYYILLPWVERVELRDVEYPYRNIQFKVLDSNIKVGKYIKNISSESNYDIRKVHFKNQYANVKMNKMSNILGFYNVNFHVRFLEETIKYIFQSWIYPTDIIRSEYHEFYFKILYYYDILGVIIWASTSREYIIKAYAKYIHNFDSSKNNIKRLELELSKSSTSDTIKHKDALKKNRILWVPPEIQVKYKASLKQSLALLEKSSKKLSKKTPKMKVSTAESDNPSTNQFLDNDITKTDADKLPVGHFLQNVPRFFHPEKDWYDAPEYTFKGTQYKENELIVGYHEKSPSGFKITFKLRSPIHKIIRHEDIRKIEKGSICSTYSKVFLIELLTNLGEKPDTKFNVPTLCQQIESKLLFKELQERKKGTNIKYFYSFWEPRPDQNVNNPIVREEIEAQANESKIKLGGRNGDELTQWLGGYSKSTRTPSVEPWSGRRGGGESKDDDGLLYRWMGGDPSIFESLLEEHFEERSLKTLDVLEIGPGKCGKSLELAKLVKSYTALEQHTPSYESGKELIKKENSNIKLSNVSLGQFRISAPKDSTYDIIIMRNVFHFWDRMPYIDSINILRSLLNDGGIIYIEESKPEPEGWAQSKLNKSSKDFDRDMWKIKKDQLEKELEYFDKELNVKPAKSSTDYNMFFIPKE